MTWKRSHRRRRTAAAGVLAAVLALAAGCSSDDDGGDGPASSPSPSATPQPQVGAACPADAAGGTQVRFGEDDYLGGVVMGSGTTGIVLAHEYQSDSCNWLPYAKALAAKGYTTLAFDFAGNGGSVLGPGTQSNDADVEQAAAYLKSHGATKIVLMGASMGAEASLNDVGEVAPEAVVSLATPLNFLNEAVDAAGVTVPVLLIAGKDDSNGGFADAARIVAKQVPSKDKTVKIVDSSEHGTGLLRSAQSGTVEKSIEAFLATYAPPTTS
ncbi:alpha/beta hydrolase family protein [Luteimicrobium sp. DT211]|uniref:alpha/beta hydrolase family protein n=1 Tax=Luteimicrobium sp. DT211 TaxID=3393412 RepID=UPI003CF4F28B